MGFGTVVSGTLILMAIAMSIALFVSVFMIGINFLKTTIEKTSSELRNYINVRLTIESADLRDPQTLCVNVTNDGGAPDIYAKGAVIVVDYIASTTGSRRIEVVPYEDTYVSRVIISNVSIPVNSTTAVEIAPGIVVEICFSTTQPIDVTHPVTISLALSSGSKATKVVYLGG